MKDDLKKSIIFGIAFWAYVAFWLYYLFPLMNKYL